MQPLTIKMHERAIVANDGSPPAGAERPGGLVLREHVPQGHKGALIALQAGGAVRRCDAPVGFALEGLSAGSWVHNALVLANPAPVA